MTLSVQNLIKAAQEECQNGRDQLRAAAVISQLGQIITNLQPQRINEGVADWARLVCFRASLQIKTRQAGAAAEHLAPLVRNNGLLSRDAVAHTTYANALINAGQAGAAAEHLAPLVRNNGLLSSNPVAHTTYANALINAGQAGAAAEHLAPLVRNNGLLSRDAVAHTTYANALINAGQAGAAAEHLAPLVRNNGLLSSNPVAHTTYANALINAGQAGAAAEHLAPLVRNNGLLSRDAVAFYSLCKAFYIDGRKDRALEYGLQYIKETQAETEQRHIVGVGILLAVFDENEPSIELIKTDLISRRGPGSLESAKHIASMWKEENLSVYNPDLTSDHYYGRRGTPGAVIADGGHRPISRSDRLKAGLPSAIVGSG